MAVCADDPDLCAQMIPLPFFVPNDFFFQQHLNSFAFLRKKSPVTTRFGEPDVSGRLPHPSPERGTGASDPQRSVAFAPDAPCG